MKLLKKILLLNALCTTFAPYCSAQLNTIAKPAVPPNTVIIDIRELLPEEDQKNIEFNRTFIDGFFTVDMPNKTVTSTLGKKYCYSFDEAFKLLGNIVNGIKVTPNTNRLDNLIELLSKKSTTYTTYEHYYYGDFLTILGMLKNPDPTNLVHELTKIRINLLMYLQYDNALAACAPVTNEAFILKTQLKTAYLEFRNNFNPHAGNKV